MSFFHFDIMFFLHKIFSIGLVIVIEPYSIIILFKLNIFLHRLCVSFTAYHLDL